MSEAVRLFRPPPTKSERCLIDAIYRAIRSTCGPDEEPAELHVHFQPFRMTVTTSHGARLIVEAPAS